jgi:hypothetical protein
VEHGAFDRRIQWRFGRCRRLRNGPRGARQRRWRFDPHPGERVRLGRIEAFSRTDLPGTGLR